LEELNISKLLFSVPDSIFCKTLMQNIQIEVFSETCSHPC